LARARGPLSPRGPLSKEIVLTLFGEDGYFLNLI
jgi:hypothetical protein